MMLFTLIALVLESSQAHAFDRDFLVTRTARLIGKVQCTGAWGTALSDAVSADSSLTIQLKGVRFGYLVVEFGKIISGSSIQINDHQKSMLRVLLIGRFISEKLLESTHLVETASMNRILFMRSSSYS